MCITNLPDKFLHAQGFSPNLVLPKTKTPCINVYVDFGSLQDSLKVIKCINESEKTNAIKILQDGNFKVEGTQKYGNAVVCRVDNFPGPNIDPCLTMPSEKAYWATFTAILVTSGT